MLYLRTSNCAFRTAQHNRNPLNHNEDNMDKHPTTRRWPRTLQEAFPNSVDNAYSIEGYRTPLFWIERLAGALIILACAGLFVYALLESIP